MAKRLVKSSDKKLFGVAGGIGEYFDIDPVLVRVGFVVLCICFLLLGLVAYIALAIMMPKPENLPTSENSPTSGTSPESPESGAGGRQNLLGWVLVGLGALITFATFGAISGIEWWLTAAALIVAGAAILTRKSPAK